MCSDALPPGTRLLEGIYTVGKILGRGSSGIIYLGADTRLNRPVAIKEYFPGGCARHGRSVMPVRSITAANYQQGKKQFLERTRMLARLNDPGIVHLHRYFEENNTAYAVMEYLKGQSLAERLREHPLLPEWESLEYLEELAEALLVVHEAGLVHGDVKPENILLTEDGQVALIDFGLVQEAGARRPGAIAVLTPGYAPLEQYGQEFVAQPTVDIYALGAVAYHLLTGQIPPDAADRAAGMILPNPKELNQQLSFWISKAILWAMEMDPATRPQSTREWLGFLHDALKNPEAPVSMEHAASSPLLPAVPMEKTVHTVQFSGQEPVWPEQCACCGSFADAFYEITSTPRKGIGKRLLSLMNGQRRPLTQRPNAQCPTPNAYSAQHPIRWDVPYCSHCLEHLETHEWGMDVLSRSRRHKILGVSGGAVLILCLVVGCIVGITGGSLPDTILILSYPLEVLGATAAIAGLAYFIQTRTQANSILARAIEQVHPACCAPGLAVQYLDAADNQVTFRFRNKEYAQRFQRANPGSLLAQASIQSKKSTVPMDSLTS